MVQNLHIIYKLENKSSNEQYFSASSCALICQNSVISHEHSLCPFVPYIFACSPHRWYSILLRLAKILIEWCAVMEKQDLDADIASIRSELIGTNMASAEKFFRILDELLLARAVIRSAKEMEAANNADFDELADTTIVFATAEKFYSALKNYSEHYSDN